MIKSIILAAGEGSRMKSSLPKCSHKVCGKEMVNHIIDAANDAGIEENIIILGHKVEIMKEAIKSRKNTKTVTQKVGENEPYGTAYAVKQGIEYIDDEDTVVILCGDSPLIRSKTLRSLIEKHKYENNDITLLTAELKKPKGYGRIIKNGGEEVLSIVEDKDATKKEAQIKEVNSGMYCFNGKVLKNVLGKIENNNSQNEYYMTDSIELVNKQNGKVSSYTVDDSNEIKGINSKIELSQAEKVMRERINMTKMEEGAILIDPETTYIGEHVKIGRDSVIYPGVVLEGNTIIGDGAEIGHNSKIKDSIIGDGVEIESSTILKSNIGMNTTVGPYAYIRPGSNIGKDVKIGDFVEVKNSNIGDGSKASHLAYIGDADVGKNVNIGCGVVFVNYDGINKHRVSIEDNAFIGCNVNLVSPVKVEKNAYIAAGSTITKDVMQNSLAIARERQSEIKDWKLRRK